MATKGEREKSLQSQKHDLELSSMESGRKVPQAVDIEQAVLGAMMLDPDIVVNSMVLLSEECFYNPQNRKIFNAIAELNATNKAIDVLTVAAKLKALGTYDEVGGNSYLAELTSRIGAAAHIDYHIKILIDKYIQRSLIGTSLDALKKSYDDSEPVDDLIADIQQKLFELAEHNMARDTKKINVLIEEKMNSLQEMQDGSGKRGLNSGYVGLDRVTYGWHPSDLVIIAGRPSMGKTAFVLTMARNMAVDFGIPVALFSLEQDPQSLMERLMIAETGLPADKIKGVRKMTDEDWVQLNESVERLQQAPIYIDDTPALSITDFRAKARKLKSKGVKVIIVDYLQLMTGSRELRGFREQEVAEISRSLKAVAKELKVPVIALAQLSRAAETQGGNKRPQLTHLRESGAIEQDADIVMFIHRPEMYGIEETEKGKGYVELIIAKHRNGPTGDVPMRFIGSQMKFTDVNEQEFAQFSDISSAPLSFGSKMNSADFREDDEPYSYND